MVEIPVVTPTRRAVMADDTGPVSPAAAGGRSEGSGAGPPLGEGRWAGAWLRRRGEGGPAAAGGGTVWEERGARDADPAPDVLCPEGVRVAPRVLRSYSVVKCVETALQRRGEELSVGAVSFSAIRLPERFPRGLAQAAAGGAAAACGQRGGAWRGELARTAMTSVCPAPSLPSLCHLNFAFFAPAFHTR